MRQSAQQRGYTSAWHKARSVYLKQHPLCAMCAKAGRTRAASVVDHITPHKGDQVLFWDRNNWQPLCYRCHNSTKQAQERARHGCDEHGNPIEQRAHW